MDAEASAPAGPSKKVLRDNERARCDRIMRAWKHLLSRSLGIMRSVRMGVIQAQWFVSKAELRLKFKALLWSMWTARIRTISDPHAREVLGNAMSERDHYIHRCAVRRMDALATAHPEMDVDNHQGSGFMLARQGDALLIRSIDDPRIPSSPKTGDARSLTDPGSAARPRKKKRGKGR